MSHDNKGEVASLRGAQFLRPGAPEHPRTPGANKCLDEICAHVEVLLGPVSFVIHELETDPVHIDVLVVAPTPDFPYIRLVTSGMSDLPMTVEDDEGGEVPRHVELILTLPGDWKLDPDSWQDETWYWPVRLIKSLAKFPHRFHTWLGWGHSLPDGSEPFGPGTAQCSALLVTSPTAPEAFQWLHIAADKDIHFLAVVPLYREELELKVRKGTRALLEAFERRDISDIVDPRRINVAARRWGFSR